MLCPSANQRSRLRDGLPRKSRSTMGFPRRDWHRKWGGPAPPASQPLRLQCSMMQGGRSQVRAMKCVLSCLACATPRIARPWLHGSKWLATNANLFIPHDIPFVSLMYLARNILPPHRKKSPAAMLARPVPGSSDRQVGRNRFARVHLDQHVRPAMSLICTWPAAVNARCVNRPWPARTAAAAESMRGEQATGQLRGLTGGVARQWWNAVKSVVSSPAMSMQQRPLTQTTGKLRQEGCRRHASIEGLQGCWLSRRAAVIPPRCSLRGP